MSDRIIILDTETTGKVDPQPIQVAWMEIQFLDTEKYPGGGFETVHHSNFVEGYRPSKPIEFGAMATHHIVDEDLVFCKSWDEAKIPEWAGYMVGHNVDYDWKVLGLPPDIKRICTLALARWAWPDAESHSLSALTYMLSQDRRFTRSQLQRAHDAAVDVNLTADLLFEIMKAKKIDWNPEALWSASQIARIPTTMPFGKHKGTKIKDLPKDYINWVLRQDDVDPYLRKALEDR